MALFDDRNISFYVGRVNKDTGEKAVIHQENFNKLFTASKRLNNSDGFDTARKANVVAGSFNNINNELGQNYYYFVIRRDENITTVVGNIPEGYEQWFEENEDETTPEEPVEEPPEDEPTP